MVSSAKRPAKSSAAECEHGQKDRAVRLVDPAEAEQAAATFRALGDPERLRMLSLLMDGEACVTDLAQILGAGLSTISQRLKVLRAQDLVVRRRASKHIFYALADRHVRELVRNALEHAGVDHGSARSRKGEEP